MLRIGMKRTVYLHEDENEVARIWGVRGILATNYLNAHVPIIPRMMDSNVQHFYGR